MCGACLCALGSPERTEGARRSSVNVFLPGMVDECHASSQSRFHLSIALVYAADMPDDFTLRGEEMSARWVIG